MRIYELLECSTETITMKSFTEMQKLVDELIICSKWLNSFEQAMDRLGDIPDPHGIKLSESVNWYAAKVAELRVDILTAYENIIGASRMKTNERGFTVLDKLKICYDFQSRIKSIWLTGYILITWEWDYNFWRTLDIAFYSSGEYE